MITDALTCGDCERANAPHRGYCGGCGAVLQPVCRGCRFVNDVDDCFCGGCGNRLVTPGAPAVIAQSMTRTTTRTTTPIAAVVPDELAELFVVAQPEPSSELPQNITQGDLDRLFNVGAT